MIDDTWPDLSGWYQLPEGGTIPKGMRYARRFSNGEIWVSTATRDFAPLSDAALYRTERPVTVPLPTELGARIIARVDSLLNLRELTLTADGWRTEHNVRCGADSIIRWMPATEWRER